MNKKDTAFFSFIAGAAITGSLIWLKTKIEEKTEESTITTDYAGNITDIHLRWAALLQELHQEEAPRGNGCGKNAARAELL